MTALDKKPQIWKLAVDLGLASTDKPVRDILRFVKLRARSIAGRFGCANLNQLLSATAQDVGTTFKEVHTDDDLDKLQRKYCSIGEKGFANLQSELDSQGYAITLKRLNAAKWDTQYISVIDCRASKAARSYFSKWHELAHLLTLTQQTRLVFRRTHTGAVIDAEESLMDIIAGEIGFLGDFIPSQGTSEMSFETIETIRRQVSPDASYQSASIGIVKAVPRPCILLETRLALKKEEERNARQLKLAMSVSPDPVPALRAVHVTVNQSAREIGIFFPKYWRVPLESIITRVFESGGSGRAEEDLAWWRTSSGNRLPHRRITVEARRVGDSVIALLVAA